MKCITPECNNETRNDLRLFCGECWEKFNGAAQDAPSPPPLRTIVEGVKIVEPHYHTNEQGTLTKCYHKSKTMILSWEFWFASMIGFPIEHAFWDYVPPFKYLTKLFGL
jgi:hypothetical protein